MLLGPLFYIIRGSSNVLFFSWYPQMSRKMDNFSWMKIGFFFSIFSFKKIFFKNDLESLISIILDIIVSDGSSSTVGPDGVPCPGGHANK